MKTKRILMNAMIVAAMAVPTLVMAANRMPPTPLPLPKPCVSSPNSTHRCPPPPPQPPKGVLVGVGR